MDSIKKMHRISVIWGVVMLLIFTLLTIIALNWKKNNNGYKDLENLLVDKVISYYESKYSYPTGMEVVTISLAELKENNVINELNYNGDVCDGYVNVSFDGVINYRGYIKCNNYMTKGYSSQDKRMKNF